MTGDRPNPSNETASMDGPKPRYRIDAGHLLLHLVVCAMAGMAVRPLLAGAGLIDDLGANGGSRRDAVTVIAVFVAVGVSRLLDRLVPLAKPVASDAADAAQEP